METENQIENTKKNGSSRGRTVAALIVGFLGAGLIWVFAPYVNYIIAANNITDHYLAPAALFLTFVLVLLVNPVLRRFAPRAAFQPHHIAIALALFYVACVTPGMGLLRQLPYSLAKTCLNVSQNRDLAAAYEPVGLKPWLFPSKLGYGEETREAEWFIRDLPTEQSVPWKAWKGPLLGWGSMLLACWVMMVGLGMIVYPQWRRNERLAFPLLEVYGSIIEDPGDGHLLPPIFRKKSFWVAVAVVFWLEIQEVAKLYLPGAIPAIPLRWDLSNLFTEEPLVYLPSFIKRGSIMFVLIGIAYFMPTRISLSVWVFVLLYGAHRVICTAYFPPYSAAVVAEHRLGALFGMSAGVLWLGRTHWARALSVAFSRARTEEDRALRHAAWMFLAGIAGMIAWLTGVGGIPVIWAVAFTGFGFLVALIIARLVCETGMPFLRLDYGYQLSWVKMLPISWISPAVMYFSIVISVLFPLSSVMNPTAVTTQVAGMDGNARPGRRQWMSWVLVAGLLGGLVFSGASHVYSSYHHGSTLDGKEQPISLWGTGRLSSVDKDLRALHNGHLNAPLYSRPFHIGFGAALAGALQYLSLTIPRWPLHPVGLLLVNGFFASTGWPSIFIGWLLKLLILRYGGARLYRAARPVFLGIIVGTVFGAIGQTAVPVAMVILGKPYMTFAS